MPPRLRMSETDAPKTYRLPAGDAGDCVLLGKLGLSGNVTMCELIIPLAEPEVTMSFEEIFTDESKRIRSEKEIPS